MTASRFPGLLLCTSLTLLLASCAGLQVTVPVDPITLPASSTDDRVCYTEVAEPLPAVVGTATYRAEALYTKGGIGLDNETVEIVVYGRTSDPGGTCVRLGADTEDQVLSEPVTLRAGEPRELVIGGDAYGRDLARIAKNQRYWLGASLVTGFTLGGASTIELTDGRITVGL